MTDTVQQANSTFATISSATSQTHASVQATAGAAEELLTANANIADRAREALSISRKVVTETKSMDRLIADLRNTVERIANAGRLINEIAGQTNLLALNATIEAVRAGANSTAEAVREVRGVIKCLERLASDISNSVEQQQAATSRIASQMQDAATAEVSVAASTVESALQASATVHTSVANLNAESISLQGLAERFLTDVRQEAR